MIPMVTTNHATAVVAGLYGQVTASIVLTDSVVRGCTSETGAGIAVQQNSNVTLTRCEFSDNSANLNGGRSFGVGRRRVAAVLSMTVLPGL